MRAMVRVTIHGVNNSAFAEYLRAISGDDTGRQIAQKTGNSESAISRWKAGTHVPDPKQAVNVARAYGKNPIEALIAAGYLTHDEASLPVTRPAALQLQDFSDLELAREMVRRAATEPGQHQLLEQPLDQDHPAMRPDD